MFRFLLLFLLPAVALADAPRDVLDAFSDGLNGLEGRFVQRVYDPDGEMKEESRGRVALQAPRQFRWEYEDPFPQLIVADGDQVWIYDPDLEQVQVRKQSHEEQQSPLTVLIDPSELERQFRVAKAPDQDGLKWVELTPKAKEKPFESCRLGFSGRELARMSTIDALGQHTDIEFSELKRNPSFAIGTFSFTPPAGVDVVGEMVEHAEVHAIKD